MIPLELFDRTESHAFGIIKAKSEHFLAPCYSQGRITHYIALGKRSFGLIKGVCSRFKFRILGAAQLIDSAPVICSPIIMKFFLCTLFVSAVLINTAVAAADTSFDARGASNWKPQWYHKNYRQPVTIRCSSNDTDDVADDFLAAVKKANNGGEVWLRKGETYVIGKKLDLSFLQDFSLRLDGEIKVNSLFPP